MSKRKIIEVYIEEKENDDEVEIKFQLLEQTKVAQDTMKRLVYGTMLANKEIENSVSKDKIREGITKVCNRHDYVDNDFIYDLDKELLGE